LIPRPAKVTSQAGTFTLRKAPVIAAPPALANEARHLTTLLATATGWQPTVRSARDGWPRIAEALKQPQH